MSTFSHIHISAAQRWFLLLVTHSSVLSSWTDQEQLCCTAGSVYHRNTDRTYWGMTLELHFAHRWFHYRWRDVKPVQPSCCYFFFTTSSGPKPSVLTTNCIAEVSLSTEYLPATVQLLTLTSVMWNWDKHKVPSEVETERKLTQCAGMYWTGLLSSRFTSQHLNLDPVTRLNLYSFISWLAASREACVWQLLQSAACLLWSHTHSAVCASCSLFTERPVADKIDWLIDFYSSTHNVRQDYDFRFFYDWKSAKK